MVSIDEKLKVVSGDVEHMHYLVSKGRDSVAGSQSEDSDKIDRITQYIPCATYKDYQTLNLKLEDKSFFHHCVS